MLPPNRISSLIDLLPIHLNLDLENIRTLASRDIFRNLNVVRLLSERELNGSHRSIS